MSNNSCTLRHKLQAKLCIRKQNLVGWLCNSTAAEKEKLCEHSIPAWVVAAANHLLVLQDPSKRSFHFCIVNLVIGTLYCVKGNFEFGIARIIKSMEPESQKLETDTWFYAKRCFLALLEGVAKHMINLKVGIASLLLQ